MSTAEFLKIECKTDITKSKNCTRALSRKLLWSYGNLVMTNRSTESGVRIGTMLSSSARFENNVQFSECYVLRRKILKD